MGILIKGTSKSGIAYNRPIPTGQVTSYRTGDDGWNLINGVYSYTPPSNPLYIAALDFNAVTPFLTLVDNNAFGNKDRFTDVNGLQVYANNYAIDHLTGLGWFTLVFPLSSWNTAIDSANASVLLGFSDWMIPNNKYMEYILNLELSNAMDYTPFRTPPNMGVILWTSTTNISFNTSAFGITPYLNATNNYNNTRIPKVNSANYLMVRNHY